MLLRLTKTHIFLLINKIQNMPHWEMFILLSVWHSMEWGCFNLVHLNGIHPTIYSQKEDTKETRWLKYGYSVGILHCLFVYGNTCFTNSVSLLSFRSMSRSPRSSLRYWTNILGTIQPQSRPGISSRRTWVGSMDLKSKPINKNLFSGTKWQKCPS